MTYRVVHFGTGYAGTHALRGIISHPDLELVGLVVHSDEKAGKDAGELAGVEPTGVIATQDIEAEIASDADAFCYMATTHGRLKVAIGELGQILAPRVPTSSPGSRSRPNVAGRGRGAVDRGTARCRPRRHRDRVRAMAGRGEL
jgi:4-hydroxy-tetrahydrodipicolinate reductase